MIRLFFLFFIPVFASAQKLDSFTIAIEMPYSDAVELDCKFNEKGGKGTYFLRGPSIIIPVEIDAKTAQSLYDFHAKCDTIQPYDGTYRFKEPNGRVITVPRGEGFTFIFYFNDKHPIYFGKRQFRIDEVSKEKYPSTIILLKSLVNFMIATLPNRDSKTDIMNKELKLILNILD